MCAARHPDCLPGATSAGNVLLEHLGRVRRDPYPPSPGPRPLPERRQYQRLSIELPMRLARIAGQPTRAARLVTCDVSSSGVRFEAPFDMDPDTPVELEIDLLDGPLGGRRLQMLVDAHIVRAAASAAGNGRRGWTEFAASFDEIRFERTQDAPVCSDAAAD